MQLCVSPITNLTGSMCRVTRLLVWLLFVGGCRACFSAFVPSHWEGCLLPTMSGIVWQGGRNASGVLWLYSSFYHSVGLGFRRIRGDYTFCRFEWDRRSLSACRSLAGCWFIVSLCVTIAFDWFVWCTVGWLLQMWYSSAAVGWLYYAMTGSLLFTRVTLLWRCSSLCAIIVGYGLHTRCELDTPGYVQIGLSRAVRLLLGSLRSECCWCRVVLYGMMRY